MPSVKLRVRERAQKDITARIIIQDMMLSDMHRFIRERARALGHPTGALPLKEFGYLLDLLPKIVKAQTWMAASTQAVNGANIFCGVNNGKMNALLEFSDYCRTQASIEMPPLPSVISSAEKTPS